MAGEHRTKIDPVDSEFTELSERIGSFDFIAAVRQLEIANADKPRMGEAVRVQDDIVRLSQNVGLGFKGRALHSLTKTKGAHKHRLHVNFLGLLGSNGPLPLHYSEYADQRTRHHADPTFREFIDLFNHRMLSLFYRASVQFDPTVGFDRAGNNAYEDFLGALCGLLPAASNDRDTLSDAAKRHYPAWFGASAKSPDGMVALIRDHFDLPVSIREWVGGWLPLPVDALTHLGQGRESARLGRTTHIGRQVWSVRHKFNVQLGPLDWQTFNSFKPGGERATAMHDLVRNYVGDEWDWDLEMTLKGGEVRPMSLDRKRTLGFDSWIRSRHSDSLADQSVLLNRKLIAAPTRKVHP